MCRKRRLKDIFSSTFSRPSLQKSSIKKASQAGAMSQVSTRKIIYEAPCWDDEKNNAHDPKISPVIANLFNRIDRPERREHQKHFLSFFLWDRCD